MCVENGLVGRMGFVCVSRVIDLLPATSIRTRTHDTISTEDEEEDAHGKHQQQRTTAATTAIPQIDLTMLDSPPPPPPPVSKTGAKGQGNVNVGVVTELVEASGEEEDVGEMNGVEAGMAELPTAEALGGWVVCIVWGVCGLGGGGLRLTL